MRETLLRLLAPATPLDSQTADSFAHLVDWGEFCSVLNRCGLAPLAHQRLVSAGAVVPEHVAMWLQAQYEHTTRRNLFLLQELHAVTTHLLRRGIPVLVLKGPVLGHIGVGALVRPHHDLDVLVQRCHYTHAADILRTLGFIERPEASHGFHQVFARMRPALEPSTTVELHFDLVDRGRPYVPDIAGVWARAVDTEIHGHVVRSPEITDHLLLTIMQLPHHHWNPRLLVDIAHIVHAHSAAIGWEQLTQRASAWEMRALVGSALHNAASFFQVTLPPAATAFAEPEGYVQRLQWRIARQATLEQLSPFAAGEIANVAPFLIVDRLRAVKYLVRQKVLRTSGRKLRSDQVAAATFRRIVTAVSTVLSLISVTASATMSTERRNSSGALL